jgi:hypothetical protein
LFLSTISIAASITGANDVGPITKWRELLEMNLNIISFPYTTILNKNSKVDTEGCNTNLTVSRVEQSVYSVQVLPQNRDKLYYQDKN